jgi:hypothetical protein
VIFAPISAQRFELEKAYNTLIVATNLSDPSDIIDKFYHMEQVAPKRPQNTAHPLQPW